MKNSLKLTLFLCALVFVACKKDNNEESTLDQKKQNLVGEWRVSQTSSLLDGMGEFDMTINEDGTGTRGVNGLDEVIDFDWEYQLDPEKVLFTEESTVFFTGGTTEKTVVENSADRHEWTFQSSVFGLQLPETITWVFTK